MNTEQLRREKAGDRDRWKEEDQKRAEKNKKHTGCEEKPEKISLSVKKQGDFWKFR